MSTKVNTILSHATIIRMPTTVLNAFRMLSNCYILAPFILSLLYCYLIYLDNMKTTIILGTAH